MPTARRFTWHSIGARGIIEQTAPGRSVEVAAGLRRIGLSGRERHYFDLHAVLDVKHSEAWNREAIGPLVAEDERRARAIAEGALIRLRCGARCFQRYRSTLWHTNEDDQKADTSAVARSEEHTSEFKQLMRISYAYYCSKHKNSHIN